MAQSGAYVLKINNGSNQEVAVQQKVQALQLSPNPAGSQLQLSFELAQASLPKSLPARYRKEFYAENIRHHIPVRCVKALKSSEPLPAHRNKRIMIEV